MSRNGYGRDGRARKGGHPLRLTPERRAKLLASLAEAWSLTKAAKSAGVGRTTVYEAMEADPSLKAEVEKARESGIETVEDALAETAKRGNVVACIFFLCNRAPHRWQHVNRVETVHSGQVQIDLDEIRRRTGEEWATILRRSLASLEVDGGTSGEGEGAGGEEGGTRGSPQNGSGNGSAR